MCYLKFQFHLQPGPRPAYPPGAQMGGPPRMGMPTMPPHHGYGGEWALLALCLSFIVCVCFLISLDLLCTKFHIMFLYHVLCYLLIDFVSVFIPGIFFQCSHTISLCSLSES